MTSDVFDVLLSGLKETPNNPDVVFLRTDAYEDVLSDPNFRITPTRTSTVGRIAGMNVIVGYQGPDEPNYLMDTTHEGWPKAKDFKDE